MTFGLVFQPYFTELVGSVRNVIPQSGGEYKTYCRQKNFFFAN